MWLECPKPMCPRSTVAPPSCISRAFSTMASCSGPFWNRSSSPKKIRSKTASRGISMFWSILSDCIDRGCEDDTGPHCDHTEHDGHADICAGAKPLSVVHQVQGLQAK